MKLLKRILQILFVVFILAAIISFFLPSTYKVERSMIIKAPEEVIFTSVNDLRNWAAWDPWRQMDPTVKVTLSERTEGEGASHSWTSTEMGSGTVTITHSEPYKVVNYDLMFDDFGMNSKATFILEQVPEGIKLTWMDEGDLGMNPLDRYMGLMMETWMGKDFEAGLQNIKKHCEG